MNGHMYTITGKIYFAVYSWTKMRDIIFILHLCPLYGKIFGIWFFLLNYEK